MTEDQIREIADAYLSEEYKARSTGVIFTACEIISDFSSYLSSRYCIIEKEKVEQEYVYACGRSDNGGYYDGRAAVLEDLFSASMFNAVKDVPQYTAQCETCMRRIAGEALEVCKVPTDPNRHCQWWNHESQDHCAYKIPWDKYPESYWRTILSAEQFAKAKSLNQNED